MSDLVEAWHMSSEATLFLLESIPASHLEDAYGARTRTVAAQFAHLHNSRLRCIRHVAPGLAKGIEPFPRGAQPNKTDLRKALKETEKGVAAMLADCEAKGAVRNWRGSPATLLGYLIAHDAHHRGLAMVAMRACGRKLPREVVYGQWDWGKPRSMRG